MVAVQELSSRNIYSAPVRDQTNGNYYGFLDLVDIIVYLVDSIDEKRNQESNQNFKTLNEWVTALSLESAKNLADLSSKNPMVPLRSQDSISEALAVFDNTGTHRVPIIGNDQVADIVNVLTQIDVIIWLSKHMKQVHPDIRKKTLEVCFKQLHVQPKNVVSVSTGTRVFDAFKLMIDKRITAVAVVNADGTLLSSLSAKDIKEVKPNELLAWMGRSTLEFIQMIRSKQINVTVPAFACHMHSSLDDVVGRLTILRVHRLYITDEAGKPIGVLSLGDLFKILKSI